MNIIPIEKTPPSRGGTDGEKQQRTGGRSVPVVVDTSRPLNPSEYEPSGDPDRTYKIVFAGDANVGKTSFIIRLCKGYFEKHISTTLGKNSDK